MMRSDVSAAGRGFVRSGPVGRLTLSVVITVFALAPWSVYAADGLGLTLPVLDVPWQRNASISAVPLPGAGDVPGVFPAWQVLVARARATQPAWSSPLVTTTGLLEQRFRFDVSRKHAGNGSDTTLIDNGKGLDLIVNETTEIQIAAAPYAVRSGVSGTGVGTGVARKGGIEPLAGFSDWPFLRVEERLFSSPANEGNYAVSALMQIQAPSGIARLTNNTWSYQPTLAFGKGWGDFDIQGTIGGVIPASRTNVIGYQVQTNIAFQYHAGDVFWPELEVNWTYYANGQRGGLNQVYLTPGIVVGRFVLSDSLKFTVGVGYQTAIVPSYIPRPLTPAYDHAWLFTSRLNF